MSGDASAWVPSPSPQGGASNDDTRKVASDDVLSQDNVQDKARDGHEGVGLVLLTAKLFIFALFAVWYQEKIAKL